MRSRKPYLQLRRSTSAPPDVVYDVLADLPTHLEWGGARQLPNFRIKTLSAPAEPATVGTVFSSTGAIPMSGRSWVDRSTVSIATRPEIFEFVTEARAGDSRGAMLARYVHRYELAAADGGSTVTYTLFEDEVVNPMLRFAMPGVRTLTRLMATWMFAWGFRNLVAASAKRYEAGNPRAPEMRAARRRKHEMALFIDIHESLPTGATVADAANAHQADLKKQESYGVRYLKYWVDADGRKAFCLVEAPNADAAVRVHREAHGLVAERIFEVVEGE